MTEQEKIDKAVEAALAKAAKEAEKEQAKAVAEAKAEAEQAAKDKADEAVALAQADADQAKQKAIDEAVAAAKTEAAADADKRIEAILSDANTAISDARQSGFDSASRGGRTDELKHYIVIGVSFIGGSLLAPGSRVTSDDLGTYRDPSSGLERPVKAGETLVEINEDGSPVNAEEAEKLRAVAGDFAGVPIAAVQPFSPNPTRPQGAPAQPAGGVALAEQALRTLPPQGVESDAAAAARGEQAENAAATVQAMTAGEKPRRRGSGS